MSGGDDNDVNFESWSLSACERFLRREEIRSRIKQLGLKMGRKKQIIENSKKGTKRKKEDMDESRKKRKIEVGRGIKRKWEEKTENEGEEIRVVKLRRKEVIIKDR